MSTPVVMPQLGESVTEGTVTRWLKQVGDRVEADEPLLEVSTDKVDTEIPSPAGGFLIAIAADEDDIVEVGGMLATIGESSEASAPAAAAPAPPPVSTATPSIDLPMAPPTTGAAMAPPPGAQVDSAAPPAGPAATAGLAQPPANPHTTAPPPPAPASATQAAGTEVRLPELGESVTEGTVTRWLKQVGDDVAVDEPLLEISTDKVDTEIPSPVAGTLTQIVVAEDGVVEVGGVLAVVGSADATAPSAPIPTPAPAPAPEATEPPPTPEPLAPPQPVVVPAAPPEPEPIRLAEPTPPADPVAEAPTSPATPAAEPAGSYVTPLVRKLAADHNVDLAGVTGSGVGGRIRRQDVLAAAEAAKTEAPASQPAGTAPTTPTPNTLRGTTEKMTRLRRVIAERMVESLQISAQLTTVVEADVTRIAHLRDQVKDQFLQREGVKLSYLPFFAKAVVEALKAHPTVNASIDMADGTVTYHDSEHLGMAVDTDRGLLVPVIRDAGELNIAGLARRIADLADRTRTNKVTPDELSGGTFTLTNTGSRGALFDTPIINQPQVAILGTGAVVKRPVVVSDRDGSDVIAVRSMVYLALTYDHRIVDGADAARFLSAVKDRLEEGAFEGELGA